MYGHSFFILANGENMIEFTKYELQSLLWAIEYVRERTNNCGDVMRSLKPKIQSMIDNYSHSKPQEVKID